ncbi:hypothetical protein Z043_103137 [Scleropages formosus]|uniref:Uncharacterized protein n=1 Tax=Scleropages formosus TaxID=113540 RepID=A0A0P7VN36_SCLFO|nr:hypothetical protein Z043_103137 [Scleropages formosus]
MGPRTSSLAFVPITHGRFASIANPPAGPGRADAVRRSVRRRFDDQNLRPGTDVLLKANQGILLIHVCPANPGLETELRATLVQLQSIEPTILSTMLKNQLDQSRRVGRSTDQKSGPPIGGIMGGIIPGGMGAMFGGIPIGGK